MGNRGIVGRVRGLSAGNYPENSEEELLHLTTFGDGLTSLALPELAEIVRHGDSWQVMSAAFTALAVVPTTASIIALWNGEPDVGKAYIIDSVAVTKIIIDVTTNDLFSVFVQQMSAPVAAPTDAGNVFRSLSGRAYDGRARTVGNITPLTGRWDCIGSSEYRAEAIAGSAWQQKDIPLRGRYLIPPGGAFALHVAEVTATASTFRATIRFHEVRLPTV